MKVESPEVAVAIQVKLSKRRLDSTESLLLFLLPWTSSSVREGDYLDSNLEDRGLVRIIVMVRLKYLKCLSNVKFDNAYELDVRTCKLRLTTSSSLAEQHSRPPFPLASYMLHPIAYVLCPVCRQLTFFFLCPTCLLCPCAMCLYSRFNYLVCNTSLKIYRACNQYVALVRH